jgi:uncharacterized protein (DUF362 family)
MDSSTVVLRSVAERPVSDVVRDVFDALFWKSVVPANSKVAIKVNLSTPFQSNAKASNTSVEILDAVCALLKEQTDHITVGESDGMRYKAEDAFEASGYLPILRKYDIPPVNFSRDKHVSVEHPFGKQWCLPKTLLDADVFVTLPVLKTHATTYFTGSLKNQFGCFPQYNRILLHPHLDEAIVFINRLLRPRLVVMDALVAMEGRGPINGKARELGLILGGTDPVAVDASAMRLVGLDPLKCRHALMAQDAGIGNVDEARILIDGDFERHRTQFEPAEKDLPIKLLALISRSKLLTDALILNPESFTPLRSAALLFRDFRDRLRGRSGERRTG